MLPQAIKRGDTIGVVAPSNPIVGKNIEELNLEFNKAIIDNIIYSGVYLRYKNILEEGCEANVQ